MLTMERRSRSRTRSQAGDLRVPNDDIGILRNVAGPAVLTPRAHRLLSRLSVQLRYPELYSSPAPEQPTRTSSLRLLNRDKKNIPMVHEKEESQRPTFKRWNSVQYGHKADEKPLVNIYDPNSVSPLTVLKDQYDTRRPASHATSAADPDNHYRDLELKTTTTTTPTHLVSSRVYHKMVRAFNLLLGSRPESKTLLLRYQSELDDELDEEPPATHEPFLPALNDAPLHDLDTIISEINDFQSSFVQKSHQPHDTFSRVQQKILDYKDLMTQDELSRNLSHHLLSQRGLSKSLHNDYAIKVQYETITHQYNQVRLRYPGASDPNHYTTLKGPLERTKVPLRTNVGVLGFLNRAQLAVDNTTTPWYASDSSYTKIDLQLYIDELWQREIDSLVPENSEKKPLPLYSSLSTATSGSETTSRAQLGNHASQLID